MVQLPTVTKSGSAVVRVSVPSALAAVAAMFPAVAPAVAIATPAVVALMERSLERPAKAIEEALRNGELLDLSEDQFESFLESLDALSLRAVALIGGWKTEYEAQGRDPSLRIAVTASQLSEETLHQPLTIMEAQDALSDLAGRGLLSGFSVSGYGGSQEHFRTTAPLEELLAKATSLANEAMSPPTDER